ncbi:uncharacterized protein LOC118927729 isoform X2 [Manis pentadactyla]|uniref:uncharacterized protein LOC118927729 isoform X2 n=1 Tax=Manis pentadactyla TaxID=143292 RepID=UPI00255C7411|nr:uncharacterized protein LOC118927729 isoform X2 [Manis pentadactyla]
MKKEEELPAKGNSVCQVTSEMGLFLPRLGSDPGRERGVARAPHSVVAPPHPGMLSGLGRLVGGAACSSRCRRRLNLSPAGVSPASGSREVTCGRRLVRSHRACRGEARDSRCCRWAGPTWPGCEGSEGRPGNRSRREVPAGRALRRGPGWGGAGASRIRSEPRPLSEGRTPPAAPPSAPPRPGAVYLPWGAKGRRAAGAEFRLRGASRGAGKRQEHSNGGNSYMGIAHSNTSQGCLWSTLQLSLEQESNVRVESGGERKMTDWEGGIVARASLQRDGLKFAVLPAVFWWTEDARRGNPERTGALGRAAFCGGPMFRPTVG